MEEKLFFLYYIYEKEKQFKAQGNINTSMVFGRKKSGIKSKIRKTFIVVAILAIVLGLSYFFPAVVDSFIGDVRGLFGLSVMEGNNVTIQETVEAVYFCPEDDCADNLIMRIGSAKETLHIAIYSFTLDEIGDAVINAYERGVEVKVVFEEGQISQYSEYEKLKSSGIPVKKDSNPSYMHNKFAVIDNEIVVTGSFNWSKNADERNDENLIIIKNKELAQKYEAEFQEIYEAAK